MRIRFISERALRRPDSIRSRSSIPESTAVRPSSSQKPASPIRASSAALASCQPSSSTRAETLLERRLEQVERSLALAREREQRDRLPRRRGRLGGRVRVDERDLQAGAAGAHEQELVAARVVVAGDRQRQRREEVALDRPLQRPRAEVGREALGEQELERRVVELDRPLAPAQPAPRQHRLELAGEDLAHHGSRQRPEDDGPVDPVEELRPERARDGCRDARLGEPGRRREPEPAGDDLRARGSRS